eukprot:CAMPEP_0117792416 /NCGR_PEP_ID=MMETSP0948-20121206/9424_1 /TAXON_ID=44440 /ORGANISM="Chattonella subsalsa, Strain CCMP2191" /LENGTH=66 /DNA_ID=CAMNT_0005622625 /DNA_START=924 /DNA_END=1121 /DNA_ORIENTATION=-
MESRPVFTSVGGNVLLSDFFSLLCLFGLSSVSELKPDPEKDWGGRPPWAVNDWVQFGGTLAPHPGV